MQQCYNFPSLALLFGGLHVSNHVAFVLAIGRQPNIVEPSNMKSMHWKFAI